MTRPPRDGRLDELEPGSDLVDEIEGAGVRV